MADVVLEMTQGDSFYGEIAFVDASGDPIDLTGWGIAIGIKVNLSDTATLVSLSLSSGIALLTDTGVISVQFAGSALSGISIPTAPRNGELLPSRTIYGDVKLTPPTGTELVQNNGSRTLLLFKVYLGVTA